MRAANISLAFVSALASDFAGAFGGGFAGGLTGAPAVALVLLLPVGLGAARWIGLWLARRADPPSNPELKLGCGLYIAVNVLLCVGVPADAAFVNLILTIGIAWVINRTVTYYKKNYLPFKNVL